MKVVSTENAPKAIGPYSQAVIVNNIVYTSGQIPLCPISGCVVGNEISTQTEQVCKNLIAVLDEAGSSISKVIKTTCFLEDIKDFQAFNKVYSKYFVSKPARSCVAVKDLPKGVKVEIEVVAEI